MREHAQLIGALLIVAGAAFIVRKNLWRAVLYLFPTSVRVEEDAPADSKVRLPHVLAPFAAQLEALGLKFIGTHLEQPRLKAAQLWFDYASAEANTFASLFVDDDGNARVELLTPVKGGGFVRTASYRRSAFEATGYFSGYLENVPLDRLLHAHQRRTAAVGSPQSVWDVAARVAAARAWYQSHGAWRELRQQHQSGLVWTFGAVVSAGVALSTLVR